MTAILSQPQCVNLVITVPTDAWAPNSARPPVGLVLTTRVDVISFMCLWQSLMLHNINSPPLDKMATIFMNEKFCISIQISLAFLPKGPIDNKQALFQVMAWRWTGDKSLTEPMLTQFTDTYMHH